MDRNFQDVDSHEMLEIVLARLQECQCHTLPVTHQNVLVGLMTMDNIGEFFSLQAALANRVPVSPAAPERVSGPLNISGRDMPIDLLQMRGSDVLHPHETPFFLSPVSYGE
jgi:hypothetical protein